MVRADVMRVRHPRSVVFILFPSPDPPDPALVPPPADVLENKENLGKKFLFLRMVFLRKM